MKSFRPSAQAKAGATALTDAANVPRMTHAEEVKALMAKGMKIAITRSHIVWAFAPKAIAEVCGAPYSAALPASADLAEYMAIGGHVVRIP